MEDGAIKTVNKETRSQRRRRQPRSEGQQMTIDELKDYLDQKFQAEREYTDGTPATWRPNCYARFALGCPHRKRRQSSKGIESGI